MWIIRWPVYFSGLCLIRKAARDCKGSYNLAKVLSGPKSSCSETKLEEEKHRYTLCNREIPQEEYKEFNGLCHHYKGGPIQRGFPSPKGFPKI